MRRAVFGTAVGAALIVGLLWMPAALASSHREAPFITSLPKADGTDFYMFNSYESGRQGYVTFIADYQPLQQPGAGPNFYTLDPEVQYDINIDNSGHNFQDITFRFQFGNNVREQGLDVGGKHIKIPLRQSGAIASRDDKNINDVELYSIQVLRGAGASRVPQFLTNRDTGERILVKPIENLGQKSISDYEKYARQHIYNVSIPGCAQAGRVFVGQRKDPFAVNVAELFDLANLKDPLGAMDQGKDDLAQANVTSFVLEVPASCVVGQSKILGGWTTSSYPCTRIGNQSFLPKEQQNTACNGAENRSQVSRVGMPLVNEAFIGLKDKDRFNSSEPKDDAQFLDYVTNPTLPTLIATLFADKGVKAPTVARTDLVTVFLKGIPGVNENGGLSEMLRLNTTTSVTAAGQQSNLGVLGKDSAGFPNGRRPGDDVVDIELRVAMGALLTADQAPSGQLPFTDGAYVDSKKFDDSFPYLRAPISGSPMPSTNGK